MRGRTLNILAGILLSVVAIYLAAAGVDYASVGATLTQADPWLVGAALASVLVNMVAKAVRWKLLMGVRGEHVALAQSLRLHLVGQMLNNVLPARVGDLSRVYMAGELGIARSFVLGTVALEKVLDLLCYALIFALLLLLMPLPAWVQQPAYLLVVLSVLALGGLVMGLLFRRRSLVAAPWMLRLLPQRFRERADTMLGDILDSLHVLADGGSTLRVALWSALIWFTAALTNAIALWALDISAPASSALFVLFVLVAGINLPAAPGRIGIFEYLCVLALAVFGIQQATALSYGLLLHALVYLPPVIGGLIALWMAGRSNEQPVQSGIGKSS